MKLAESEARPGPVCSLGRSIGYGKVPGMRFMT